MRVMVIVKASKESEAGQMPSTEILAAMGKYNEELVKAGVMKAGEARGRLTTLDSRLTTFVKDVSIRPCLVRRVYERRQKHDAVHGYGQSDRGL